MRCGPRVAAAVLAVVCGSLLLWPAATLAQETTGAVIGTIRSQDGLPLPGVTVAVANPETGFRLVATTDGRGEYRVLALPPASYELTAALDGFREVRQTLTVALGQTVKNAIEMVVGAFAEAVEVTAEMAPLVDVTSTVVGMTVKVGELNDRIPVQREATQVALLAAGTQPGDAVYDDSTPGQRLASFSGASVAENLYVVNGLNVTNFRGMLGSTRVPFEFLDEVQVKTGGYEAEFGRSTGGVINMVTRSGSNALHGSASLYYEPESLQAKGPAAALLPNRDERRRSLEGNLSLGGPVVTDRLFYFLFADYVDTDSLAYLLHPGAGNAVTADLDETSQPYWGGKIDWNLAVGHRLEGTYLSDRVDTDFTRWQVDLDSESLGEPLGMGVHERGGGNAIVKYSGVLGKRTFLSLQAGRNAFDRTDRSDGDDCPVAIDRRSSPVKVIGCWVNPTRSVASDTRHAYRADLDVIAGAHALRAGIDYERNMSKDDTSVSGGVGYQYYLNGTRFPTLPASTEVVAVGHLTQGGSFDVLSNAAYVQDSWAVSPRVTLNLGLRWERYDNRNGRGQTFIETDDQYAPRLGVVWDPSGDGRAKVYANYGVYYLPIASNTNVRVAGAVYRATAWYVLEGGVNDDGSPVGLGTELSNTVTSDGETPDPRELLSDNFKPMSQDEAIIGYERMIGDTWSVGVRGVGRKFDQVIEDYSIQQGLAAVYGIDPETFVYRIGNPGSSFDGWYDLDDDGVLDRIHLPASALGYPKAERRYYALELTFHRRFADNWMLQGSYVWSHLYGNYEGYTNSDVGQSDPGATITFDTPGLLEHATGDLPNDRRHTFKVFGSYSWPFGLQLGGNFFFQTGRPINSFGLHPTDEDTRSYGPVAFYTGGEPRPRGCCGRTDDVWSLDVMARYDFHFHGVDLNLRFDVFNVFNKHAVTRVDEVGEDDTGAASPTYGLPVAFQPPRRIRLGIGASF
jgi:outer membrane receptor protein involved in Fe transport